jgi:hypothetical protein
MSTDREATPASVKIGPISYRARCTEAGCKNLGRLQMIYADAGGRPIVHPVVCHEHARRRLAHDRTAGAQDLRRPLGFSERYNLESSIANFRS